MLAISRTVPARVTKDGGEKKLRRGHLGTGQESAMFPVHLSCSIPKVLSAKFVDSMRFWTLNSTLLHAISSIYDFVA